MPSGSFTNTHVLSEFVNPCYPSSRKEMKELLQWSLYSKKVAVASTRGQCHQHGSFRISHPHEERHAPSHCYVLRFTSQPRTYWSTIVKEKQLPQDVWRLNVGCDENLPDTVLVPRRVIAIELDPLLPILHLASVLFSPCFDSTNVSFCFENTTSFLSSAYVWKSRADVHVHKNRWKQTSWLVLRVSRTNCNHQAVKTSSSVTYCTCVKWEACGMSVILLALIFSASIWFASFSSFKEGLIRC